MFFVPLAIREIRILIINLNQKGVKMGNNLQEFQEKFLENLEIELENYPQSEINEISEDKI